MFEVKSCKDIENITADQIRQFRDEIPGGETTKNWVQAQLGHLLTGYLMKEKQPTLSMSNA